ncbi:MAG TPA: TonB-dependent receptor plug domain-containing protein [Prolixibacteraceae bacterium]|nr:TonB-dependent receptor plug domain-containing protein [Prolixibacteraceae bacterium]
MNLSIFRRIFFFTSIIASSLSGYSQSLHDTISIKEIHIKGNRVFKKEEAGLKITKVDSLVMIDKITVSLSDILSQNTTVFIKDHGRGAMATASFRGTAPSHTQVFWNGITINSPMLGMTDFSLIPAFIIDDLELNHGAASLSEASGGLGGSIDIKNMPEWNNRLSVKYFQGIGSFSTYDEFFQLNAGSKTFQSKTRLYTNYSKNDYEYINKAILERPLVRNENADYMKKGFTQEFYFRPSENNVLTVKAWGQISSRSLPSVMSYEGDDQSNLNDQIDSTLKISADWAYYKGKAKLSVRSGVDYQNTNYTLTNRISGLGMQPAINSKSRSICWYNHISLENRFFDKISYKTSFDFNHFDVSSFEEVQKTGYERVRNDFSAFGGIYYNCLSWLNVSLVLRDEYIEKELSPLMFNLGVSIQPLKERQLILKADISRNYHQPSLNDLYWQPGGNPDLLPEESYTGEFTVQHRLDIDHLELEQEVTPYFSTINDWIIWLPSFQGYWQPFNLKKVKSFGLEYHLKLTKHIGKVELQLHGNYALTKSLNYGDRLFLGDGSYGKQLPYIPVHSGNLLLSVSYHGYYFRFQNTSYSERYTLTSNEVGSVDDSEDIGAGVSTSRMNWYYPYFMNNLSFGKDFTMKHFLLGFDFKINNLFDETYRSVLGRYMPGRNYELMVKLSYNSR